MNPPSVWNTIAPAFAALLAAVNLTGCDRSAHVPQKHEAVVHRVQLEVANVLKQKPHEIDVTKPFALLGADELDVVEIVQAIEDAFELEIPDEAVDVGGGETGGALTVQKLAAIVTAQQSAR